MDRYLHKVTEMPLYCTTDVMFFLARFLKSFSIGSFEEKSKMIIEVFNNS